MKSIYAIYLFSFVAVVLGGPLCLELPTEAVTKDLSHRWPLQESGNRYLAADTQGGLDAKLEGTTVRWKDQPYHRESTLHLNGYNNRITVDGSVIPKGTTQYTVTMWFQWAGCRRCKQTYLFDSSSSLESQFALQAVIEGTEKTLSFRTVTNNPSQAIYLQSTFSPEVNQWYFVSFVYNGAHEDGTGGFVHIYVNSQLIARMGHDYSTNVFDNSEKLVIGASSNGKNNFKGSVADVRIYTRVLSKTVLCNLYSNGFGHEVHPASLSAIGKDQSLCADGCIHGTCVAGVCECNAGWSTVDCSLRVELDAYNYDGWTGRDYLVIGDTEQNPPILPGQATEWYAKFVDSATDEFENLWVIAENGDIEVLEKFGQHLVIAMTIDELFVRAGLTSHVPVEGTLHSIMWSDEMNGIMIGWQETELEIVVLVVSIPRLIYVSPPEADNQIHPNDVNGENDESCGRTAQSPCATISYAYNYRCPETGCSVVLLEGKYPADESGKNIIGVQSKRFELRCRPGTTEDMCQLKATLVGASGSSGGVGGQSGGVGASATVALTFAAQLNDLRVSNIRFDDFQQALNLNNDYSWDINNVKLYNTDDPTFGGVITNYEQDPENTLVYFIDETSTQIQQHILHGYIVLQLFGK